MYILEYYSSPKGKEILTRVTRINVMLSAKTCNKNNYYLISLRWGTLKSQIQKDGKMVDRELLLNEHIVSVRKMKKILLVDAGSGYTPVWMHFNVTELYT